jgi:hypothetical protein
MLGSQWRVLTFDMPYPVQLIFGTSPASAMSLVPNNRRGPYTPLLVCCAANLGSGLPVRLAEFTIAVDHT